MTVIKKNSSVYFRDLTDFFYNHVFYGISRLTAPALGPPKGHIKFEILLLKIFSLKKKTNHKKTIFSMFLQAINFVELSNHAFK